MFCMFEYFDPYGPQLSGEAAEVTKKHVALTADEVQSDLGKLKNSTLHHAKDGMNTWLFRVRG